MKTCLLFFAAVCFMHTVFGQSNRVFEKYNLDSCTALICINPYDGVEYKGLPFYIDNKEDLKMIGQSFTYGQKWAGTRRGSEEMAIYLIKDKEMLDVELEVHPVRGYISIEQTKYAFDPTLLLEAASAFPLKYKLKSVEFKSKMALEAYLEKNRPDPKLLCFENFTNELEGEGTITIKIEDEEKPMRKGWNMIESELKALGATKEDYILSYSPSFTTPNVYKYYVQTSKTLFDKLSNPAFVKGKWIARKKTYVLDTYWKR